MNRRSLTLSLWLAIWGCLFGLPTPARSQAQVNSRVVAVEWDANLEANISTYIVRYGNASGAYDHVLDAGNTTSATLVNLNPGATYYCAVFARNTEGIESSPSNEISFETAALEPFINIVGLASGEVRNEGVAISLQAETSEDLTRVEFYVGSKKIGESSTESPQGTWDGAVPGENIILAKGYNAAGQLTHSSNIVIYIVKPAITAAHRKSDGTVSFNINGAPGRLQHIYTSEDLEAWTLIESAVNESGVMEFSDNEAATVEKRFYRVSSE